MKKLLQAIMVLGLIAPTTAWAQAFPPQPPPIGPVQPPVWSGFLQQVLIAAFPDTWPSWFEPVRDYEVAIPTDPGALNFKHGAGGRCPNMDVIVPPLVDMVADDTLWFQCWNGMGCADHGSFLAVPMRSDIRRAFEVDDGVSGDELVLDFLVTQNYGARPITVALMAGTQAVAAVRFQQLGAVWPISVRTPGGSFVATDVLVPTVSGQELAIQIRINPTTDTLTYDLVLSGGSVSPSARTDVMRFSYAPPASLWGSRFGVKVSSDPDNRVCGRPYNKLVIKELALIASSFAPAR